MKGRRWQRTTADIAAAAMIVTGAVLAGISFSQHQHHDHAVAVQAERKVEVDRAALAEAQQFQAQQHSATTRPEAQQASASRRAEQNSPVETVDTKRLETPAGVHADNDRAEAGSRRTRPAQHRQEGVSEIRETGATLVIPALGVDAPVIATGAVNASMTIPADIHTVGWYDGTDVINGKETAVHTPWPGQPGVSLLAGHVDWAGEGPGALFYIGQLRVGDPIKVIGSNGVATYWRVSQPPITISKAALPASLFANSGPPKLALVTCGGPFDSATGHYLDNVIVWATLN